jgi:hypothetical protein
MYVTYLQSPAQAGSSLRQLAEDTGKNVVNLGGTIEARYEGFWHGVYPAQQLIGQTPPFNGVSSPMSYYFIEANGIVYWLMVLAPGLMNQNIQNIQNFATCFQIVTPQPQGPSQSLPPDLQSQIRLMEWQIAFQNQRDSFVVMSNILSSITP